MNPTFKPLIICADDSEGAPSSVRRFFVGSMDDLSNFDNQNESDYLTGLVHELSRNPGCLLAHVRRIYWCYRERLTEPLFAALVDFLMVLNHRGHAISRKMVQGARSQLTAAQRDILNTALADSTQDIAVLPGNRFSVFSKGLEGTSTLIETVTAAVVFDHDPLHLAEDAMKYSQLDEAMTILEVAIQERPERLPLHHALLELYRSTHEQARFEKMASELSVDERVLPEDWKNLKNYFKGRSDSHVE
ncbi:MAG: hypothetical protein CVV13_02770 [Gammaproteobacteria bacterium HGW-Gammaproteobacteria-3]|nr:MAG: hypothetical protein CVV13_02770 [Gammaproteobacteria bacterium HGW-Gammaproteobacteria-3]